MPAYPGPWITPTPDQGVNEVTGSDAIAAGGTSRSFGLDQDDADSDIFNTDLPISDGIIAGAANNGDGTFNRWQGHPFIEVPTSSQPSSVFPFPAFPPHAVDIEFETSTMPLTNWLVTATLTNVTGTQTDHATLLMFSAAFPWFDPGNIADFVIIAEHDPDGLNGLGQLGPPNSVIVPGAAPVGYSVVWQPDLTYWLPGGFGPRQPMGFFSTWSAYGGYEIYTIDYLDQPPGELITTWELTNRMVWAPPRYRWIYDQAPPQRQYPRDDGLGISTRRSWPPPTTRQFGLRRGPVGSVL